MQLHILGVPLLDRHPERRLQLRRQELLHERVAVVGGDVDAGIDQLARDAEASHLQRRRAQDVEQLDVEEDEPAHLADFERALDERLADARQRRPHADRLQPRRDRDRDHRSGIRRADQPQRHTGVRIVQPVDARPVLAEQDRDDRIAADRLRAFQTQTAAAALGHDRNGERVANVDADSVGECLQRAEHDLVWRRNQGDDARRIRAQRHQAGAFDDVAPGRTVRPQFGVELPVERLDQQPRRQRDAPLRQQRVPACLGERHHRCRCYGECHVAPTRLVERKDRGRDPSARHAELERWREEREFASGVEAQLQRERELAVETDTGPLDHQGPGIELIDLNREPRRAGDVPAEFGA